MMCCPPQGKDGRGVNVLLRRFLLCVPTEDFVPHLVDCIKVLAVDCKPLITESFFSQPSWGGTVIVVHFLFDCWPFGGGNTILGVFGPIRCVANPFLEDSTEMGQGLLRLGLPLL